MSHVFKLFIWFLLFIELLLIDGCKYYDGQRVRLKDLKKDELNGKYGIINNQNNKNEARIGAASAEHDITYSRFVGALKWN